MKIRFYFERATIRRDKERAANQLATQRAVYIAVAAANNGQNFGHYQNASEQLRRTIEGESQPDQTPTDNINKLRLHLMAAGARVSHSPLSK